MRVKSLLYCFLALILLAGASSLADAQDLAERYPIIPKPVSLSPAEGSFAVTKATEIVYSGDSKELAGFISEFLSLPLGKKLKVKRGDGSPHKNTINIILKKGNGDNAEAYQLEVQKDQITISAATAKGAFWGFQSLRQLMPASVEGTGPKVKGLAVPCVKITDYPRFAYRGLHLDVGRHFFPVDFIKKYIDLIAFYKLDKFHWHLTEDQGWRIEIKKYPKLQKISAYRDQTLIGKSNPPKYDGERYGGYYTQKEVKEVVEYARQRYITVIPEIELPGHSLAALAAYPELGCTGGPYHTSQKWGVFPDIYCAGNEKTFEFLENVLTEVMDLFPSKYIHIGGDEAPKSRWEKCPKCQARIKAEGLKNEHELQSYFVQRMEKFLNKHGRSIIGWDEILEGGLAPNATVMSWRGEKGGIEAARQHHQVIMTPNNYLYLDYYQSKSPSEPLAIGGYVPVEKVYNYNPVPEVLTDKEAEFIIGVQANLWTEYIATSDYVEYMVFPRAVAMAEIAWTPNEAKDYEDFLNRLKYNIAHLKAMDVNYAEHVFGVQSAVKKNADGMELSLWSEMEGATIRYSLDGTTPTASSKEYSGPIIIKNDIHLKAANFDGKETIGGIYEKQYFVHHAIGKKTTLKDAPSTSYDTGGAQTLVDGIKGSARNTDAWLGWNGKDMEVVIDMDDPTLVKDIKLSFGNSTGDWIYAPKQVEVLFSYDGYSYTPFYDNANVAGEGQVVNLAIPVNEENIRYIKVIAHNYGEIPAGNPGAGNSAWLFVDEIEVE